MSFILAHDLGTSSNKAVLVTEYGEIVAAAAVSYDVVTPYPNWTEQDPTVWWDAVCRSSQVVLKDAGVAADEIEGITFAGQMQGTLPVDANGSPLMNCMIWLDGRAEQQARQATRGWLKVQGYGLSRLARWLYLTNGAPNLAGKDPVAKMLWLRDTKPDLWKRTHKILDVKDYLLHRSTGKFVTSHDCGNSTWLMDTRKGRLGWSDHLLDLVGIPREKLPDLVPGSQVVGDLTAEAAREMGLPAGIPVVAGAGDVVAMTVGTGAVRDHEFHLGIGTSAWVATHVPERKRDLRTYIASICSAITGRQLLVAHQETGGACVEWARETLGGFAGGASANRPTYKDLDALVESYDAGANNLLFLPWMAGEYAPVDDKWARGGFVNLSLEHQYGHMVRAVYEGVALNARWALSSVEKLIGEKTESLRFAGGGALSEVWCQILADVLDRPILQQDRPRLAAARGVALIASHALGFIPDFDEIGSIPTGRARFEPSAANRTVYDDRYALFVDFYRRNKAFFRLANADRSLL